MKGGPSFKKPDWEGRRVLHATLLWEVLVFLRGEVVGVGTCSGVRKWAQPPAA